MHHPPRCPQAALENLGRPLARTVATNLAISPALVLLLVLITALPQAAANQEQSPAAAAPAFIPGTIAGMTLTELMDGAQATAVIDRMHRGTVATQANFIATYQGPPGSATLYVSLYDDPGQAVSDREEMAEIIAKKGHGFSHLKRRTQNGLVFYMALGQGQAHYFFARGHELAWLAVDIDVAEQALKDVLQAR